MATTDQQPAKQSIFARLDKLNEFERQPVTPDKLQSGRYFAGLFSGEHVAATEFVIGALFVVWGARTTDILLGLLLGNLLAVLSWTIVCAPIAVRTRLTLYWYLRQIGGPVMTVIYNMLNAVLYCILAGCMITVSASAVRIPFGIAPQTGFWPQDWEFVLIVWLVGAVVVTLAILGFKRLSQFAVVCSPWMILMFVCGALMAVPVVGHVSSWQSFLAVANQRIWTGKGPNVSRISQDANTIVLDLDAADGRVQILSGVDRADALSPALAEQMKLPGFYLSADSDPKKAQFVPCEARFRPILGEAPKPAPQASSQSTTSSIQNVGWQKQEANPDGTTGVEKKPPAGGRRRSRGGPTSGEAPIGPMGLPVRDPQTGAPPPPPVLGWQIVLSNPEVQNPQSVKYVMPKRRDGVICDDNFVPLQSFQASLAAGSRPARSPIGFWHIVFFAWICNLAMHLGLSDMAIFRFAKSAWYGLYSAFGMFLGHYLAWICAGVMGAAAARIMLTPLMQLDSGQVAYLILGWAGAIAVVVAGWTTSNPTLYRAGLALQVITPNWPRWLVTLIAGVITTSVACFPFVFLYLLDFVGLYGILLMPVGAIVVIEHWLFPILGWEQLWATKRGYWLNIPALLAWALGLALGFVCWWTGWLHLFFLVIPVWFTTAIVYLVLAGFAGAWRRQEPTAATGSGSVSDPDNEEPARAANSQPKAPATAGEEDKISAPRKSIVLQVVFGLAALLCLVASVGFAGCVFLGYMTPEKVKPALLNLAIAYFVAGTLYVCFRERSSNEPEKSLETT